MHQLCSCPESPQRHGAQLVGGIFAAVLHNAVAGSDIVQQVVAERVDDLVSESFRHRILTAEKRRAGGCGLQTLDMTSAAFKCTKDG